MASMKAVSQNVSSLRDRAWTIEKHNCCVKPFVTTEGCICSVAGGIILTSFGAGLRMMVNSIEFDLVARSSTTDPPTWS